MSFRILMFLYFSLAVDCADAALPVWVWTTGPAIPMTAPARMRAEKAATLLVIFCPRGDWDIVFFFTQYPRET
jgi:hypothetical protein